eukprot:3878227-Rhodomonas_salina.3
MKRANLELALVLGAGNQGAHIQTDPTHSQRQSKRVFAPTNENGSQPRCLRTALMDQNGGCQHESEPKSSATSQTRRQHRVPENLALFQRLRICKVSGADSRVFSRHCAIIASRITVGCARREARFERGYGYGSSGQRVGG